jgi:hypothetical protein
MANIASTDLVYAFAQSSSNAQTAGFGRKYLGPAGYQVRGTITIGNNTLTYGSGGGIPLLKGKMGLPRFIRSFEVLGSDVSKYAFEYIPSTESILIKVLASTTPTGNVAAVTGTVAAPTITLGTGTGSNVAADLVIGVSSAANAAHLVGSANNIVSITGVQAPAFTGNAPAFSGDAIANKAFSELGNVAITTSVLQILAQGY